MERICCLQDQFDKDYALLPEPQLSLDSFNSDIQELSNRDVGLKISFLRLCRLMHLTMLLTLVYFCNICLWFMMSKPAMPRAVHNKFIFAIPFYKVF